MLPQSLKLRSWAFRLTVGGFGLLNGLMVPFRAVEVTNPWLYLPATVSIVLGVRAAGWLVTPRWWSPLRAGCFGPG